MKTILGIAGLVFVALAGWRIGAHLSSDAIGMAVGILFGILAGIPACLIILAGQQLPQRHQQQPPTTINIVQPITPHSGIEAATRPQVAAGYVVDTAKRGQMIESILARGRLRGLCVAEYHERDRSAYEFRFQIGTKVSMVDEYCRSVMSELLNADCSAYRCGGVVRIIEQRKRDVQQHAPMRISHEPTQRITQEY